MSGISLDCLCFAGLLNIFTISITDRYKNGILFNIAEKYNKLLNKTEKNQPLLCKSGDPPPVGENVCNLLTSNWRKVSPDNKTAFIAHPRLPH